MFITYMMIIGLAIGMVAFIHTWHTHRCRGYMLLPNPLILLIQVTGVIFLLELAIIMILSLQTGNMVILEELWTDAILLSLVISPLICLGIVKILIKRYAQNMHVISDNIHDGVIAIDENGIINYANIAAVSLFDYSTDELIGKSVNILMPMQYGFNHDQYLDNYLATGINNVIGRGRETIGRRKDGSMFPVYLSISEIRSDNRHIFVGIIQDISEKQEVPKQKEAV